MQSIQTKSLGTQYYNDTPPEFVGIPVQEMKALNKAKEDNYILAKNSVNELDKMLRTLPKLPQSSGVYDNLKAKTEKLLGSVNADNYTDVLPDIQQFGNDFMNKLGGTELASQASQMQDAFKEYDDAEAKGDIVDPNFTMWLKNKTMQDTPGLTIDDKGYVSKAVVHSSPIAPYVDGQQFLIDQEKDWKANGAVTKILNKDGSYSYNISDDIMGQLALTKNTGVTEAELHEAGLKGLQANDKYQAYLDNIADYKTQGDNRDAETIYNKIPSTLRKDVFGKNNATIQDVQNGINNGTINPDAFIKNVWKSKEMFSKSQFATDKYSYNDEDVTMVDNKLLLESLKHSAAIAKTAKEQLNNVSTTIEPFSSQTILNPTDIVNIESRKSKAVDDRTSLQAETYAYQKALLEEQKNPPTNGKGPSFTQEALNEKNRQLTQLDKRIQNLNDQETSIGEVMRANALKGKVDLDATWKRDYNQGVSHVKLTNQETIKELDYTADITNQVKYDGNRPYIDTPTLDKRQYLDGQGNQPYKIFKMGNNFMYEHKATEDKGTKSIVDNDNLFQEDGTLKPSTALHNKDAISKFYKVPTKEEFTKMAVQAYNNKDEEGMSANSNSGLYEYTNVAKGNYKLMTSNGFLSDIEKIRKSQGEFKWDVTVPLSYLMVTGATQKDAEMAYVTSEESVNKSFRKAPEQYSVDTPNGIMSLGAYMKDKYRLPAIDPRFINWQQSNIETLLQTDREYGQKYGIEIQLTAKGKEYLESKGLPAYSETNRIKITGLATGKDVRTEQNRIKDSLLRTYAGMANDPSEHSKDNAKQMGMLYFNSTPEGQAFNSKNFYTMAAGEIKTFDIRGAQYEVSATTRDATKSDLMNVDYHMSKIVNGERMTIAEGYDDTAKSTVRTWKPLSMVQANDNWKQVTFETPADMTAVIGSTMMDADHTARKPDTTNYYAQYMEQFSTSHQGNGNAQNSYQKTVTTTQRYYNMSNDTPVVLKNYTTNQNVPVNINVPKEDLLDLIPLIGRDRVATGVELPYINKAVAPSVKGLMSDYDVTITGGFRGTNSANALKGAKNSMHKYGCAVDLRLDTPALSLYDEISNDPELRKQYNILSIKKESNPDHVHVEFTPNLF